MTNENLQDVLDDLSTSLYLLKNHQYLIECLNDTVEKAGYESRIDAESLLDKLSVILRAYDNPSVVKTLKENVSIIEDAIQAT